VSAEARRQVAVQQFVTNEHFSQQARVALEQVLGQSPRALMIVWETESGMNVTSVPFSVALSRGLADLAYDILWEMTDEDSE
jgi:hypothetical protein